VFRWGLISWGGLIVRVKFFFRKIRGSELRHFKFVTLLGKLELKYAKFSPRGRGLGHVTPKIFGIRLNIIYLQNYLSSGESSNNFPQKGRGLGHVSDVTPKIFGIQSNITSKLLEPETLNLGKGESRAGAQIISPKMGVA